MSITRQEILERLRAFELSHPVEGYRCYDWNVWPLLRVVTAFQALAEETGATGSGPGGNREGLAGGLSALGEVPARAVTLLRRALAEAAPVRALKLRRARREYALALEVDPERNQDPTARREVVLLSLSGRRVRQGELLYEPYADPVAETLDRLGVSHLTWERREERGPRSRPSAWISRLLELRLAEAKPLPPLEEPPWFRDFAPLAQRLVGRRVPWAQSEAEIRLLQQRSQVFQGWLSEVGARLLISVCWYDPKIMAASLAAQRLGLISVDLQHGMQDEAHYAYAGWCRIPAPAYELVPRVFWSWGEGEASRLMQRNPAFAAQSLSLVCGNLWLNKWREADLSLAEEGLEELRTAHLSCSKKILITLQGEDPYLDLLAEAISQGPPGWCWLVRLHPATPAAEREQVNRLLKGGRGARVEIELCSRLSLFTLLQSASVHITGHSTCALESLAFGVPTITLTQDGVDAFRKYLDKGVMLQASGVGDLLKSIGRCEAIAAGKCREAVADLFAPYSAALEGVERLLKVSREAALTTEV